MTKWPVEGSVADRPEGVLQNVRENLGWPGGGVFEAREEYCFYESLSEKCATEQCRMTISLKKSCDRGRDIHDKVACGRFCGRSP